MNYSSFDSTDELNTNTKNTILKTDIIKQYVEKNGLILLKCDYFGVDSYYYNKSTKIMYKVCNVYNKYADRSIQPIFEISNDAHILWLNNLL